MKKQTTSFVSLSVLRKCLAASFVSLPSSQTTNGPCVQIIRQKIVYGPCDTTFCLSYSRYVAFPMQHIDILYVMLYIIKIVYVEETERSIYKLERSEQ